jgi:hypothetical protein
MVVTNLYLILSAGNLISVAVRLCEAGKGGSTAQAAQLVFFFYFKNFAVTHRTAPLS